MKYLSSEDILQIHSMLIDETGGIHGVLDRHVISSLEDTSKQKVFGKELYPTIFDKAAVYARNIILGHPFLDGNKRTGMTAASVFLEDNGYEVLAEKRAIERLGLKIVREKLGIRTIAAWLRRHSRRRNRE